MTPAQRVQSYAVQAMLSPVLRRTQRSVMELRRRLRREPHRVTAFLRLDDPYSALLAECLPELAAGYEIELDCRMIEGSGDKAHTPAPARLERYAIRDASALAAALGLPFDARPAGHFREGATASLAVEAGLAAERFAEDARAYWSGDTAALERRVARLRTGTLAEAKIALDANRKRLEAMGHYASAMLHYGGEWYWGVDRLHYLAARLDELGARRRGGGAARDRLRAVAGEMRLRLPAPPSATPPAADAPLEFYYSFRSPYSWLALERCFALADAFGLALDIRPVLPMVMRGLPVPPAKRLYIVRDAKREAERHRIPFGKIADPLGRGVERCLAVFPYAAEQGRAREFLSSAGRAIWAERIDVATDKGLSTAVERAGLSPRLARRRLEDQAGKALAERNRERLTAIGLWGVPSFRLGDIAYWGQDRLWLLARDLERHPRPGRTATAEVGDA